MTSRRNYFVPSAAEYTGRGFVKNGAFDMEKSGSPPLPGKKANTTGKSLWCLSKIYECRLGSFFSIMGTALGNLQHIISDAIDNAVFSIYTAAPPPLQVSFQGLRLSNSAKGIALYIPEQFVDALEQIGILVLPLQIFIPSFI